VSLFKHANLTKLEQSAGVKAADKGAVSELRMAMLRSWLPLLCRDSNGTDAPVLSSRERSEMVGVLEELIGKLSWSRRRRSSHSGCTTSPPGNRLAQPRDVLHVLVRRVASMAHVAC
jgi:hypothetical protein